MAGCQHILTGLKLIHVVIIVVVVFTVKGILAEKQLSFLREPNL